MQQVNGNFKCTRRWNAPVHLQWCTLMASIAQRRSLLLSCRSEYCRIRDAASAIQILAKRRERNFLPVLHRPNKNVARKCRRASNGRPMQMGRRDAMAGQRWGTSREIFAILVFALSLTLKIWNCFADGWADDCALTMKFQSEENVREREEKYA